MRHILVDVLDRDLSVEKSVKSVLANKCALLYEKQDFGLSMYLCGSGNVYLKRVNGTLLIDVINAEDSLEDILKILPRHHLMIRLVERGIPSD